LPIPNPAAIRRALLTWYARAKRDLPWRQSRDPYAIWISEIMLQQTRVAAVLPYYERFLRLFPTVEKLATAREDDVLTAWSGLGYYSRARNFRKAAIQVAQRGAFPDDYAAIRSLPGIGDYTAAAVASIAFGLPHAAIDGNALRVFSRLTADPGDIGSATTRNRLAALADELIDRKRPGDFNQAVMELGATICLPKAPECSQCPLSRHCAAYQSGEQNQYPVKLRKAQKNEVSETLFYIERDGKVLFWRRDAASKRLAGFWELPEAVRVQHAVDGAQYVGKFRHTIVNTTYRFDVVSAAARVVPPDLVWVAKDSLHRLPLSTTAKKALRCINLPRAVK
jgi:A/G-specific adenine glycosylase